MNFHKTTVAAGIGFLVLAAGATLDLTRNSRSEDNAAPVGGDGRTRHARQEIVFYQRQAGQRLEVLQDSKPEVQPRRGVIAVDVQQTRNGHDGRHASVRIPGTVSSSPANTEPTLLADQHANHDQFRVEQTPDEATSNVTGPVLRMTGFIEKPVPAQTGQVKHTTSEPVQRKSVASTLSNTLSDPELSDLGSHEQAAIVELGVFDENETPSPQTGGSTPVSRPGLSESDAYLRATLGHDRFNQLSFLAALKRYESGVNPASESNKSPD